MNDTLYDYEKQHLIKMRTYAPECMVLLKKNGDFPLREPGNIALYGSGARDTIKGGTGSGDVNARFYYTVEQGLEEAGFIITSKAWLDGYDAVREKEHKKFIEDIKRQAKEQHKMAVMFGMGAVMPEPDYMLPLDGSGDVALYVLARISGEGNDRKPEAGDFKLSKTEIRDILTANKKYKYFMLVLNVGGVVDLSPVADVDNILVLSQLGSVTGQALADVMLGKSTPSGKLTATWSAWEDYANIGDFGEMDDTRYQEGVYVGYRYFDSMGIQAMYPFGFGLTYTEFEFGKTETALNGTSLAVTVPVINTGALPGKEVVQVYVSVPWGKLDQPYQTLAGFEKTKELAPGETQMVTVSFRLESLAGYDTEKAAYILEAGNYIVRVGNSSRNTVPAAIIKLKENVDVCRVTNVGGTSGFRDWKPDKLQDREPVIGLPMLEVDSGAFGTLSRAERQQISAEAQKIAAELTDEQLAYLCIGNFKDGMGVAGIIGDASQTVAGAAGETSARIAGIPPLVMADGPAGLRLSKQYTRDEKGVHSVGSTMPAGLEDFFGPVLKFLLELLQKKPKGEILTQYCTAIPIGTALAQSWNLELCEDCGAIVGEEMEQFGIHLWLAPALNIHRSPLCGRNFEYYSEDPLISGRVGAAVTKGVQSYAGRGVTIKHFCCNNQETNRYTSNSAVSERALREIYLRGFQICVEESSPCAIMTSYNLLNGTHTSERSDLLKTVVRGEWGYDGLIMTDWIVSVMAGKGKYRNAKPVPSIKAGNDVFMPGSPADYKAVMKALRGKDSAFSLTRDEVIYCAEHVVDMVFKLYFSN